MHLGNKRNHSLKATCATHLYQGNVDEQQIMECTGHQSLAGVHAYKQTANVQVENLSAILDGTSLNQLAMCTRGSVPTGEHVNIQFNM